MGTTLNTNIKYPNLNSYFNLSKYFKSNTDILKTLITNININTKEEYYNKDSKNIKDLNDFDDMF